MAQPFAEHVFSIHAVVKARLTHLDGADDRRRGRLQARSISSPPALLTFRELRLYETAQFFDMLLDLRRVPVLSDVGRFD
jgi:hypothetical protein